MNKTPFSALRSSQTPARAGMGISVIEPSLLKYQNGGSTAALTSEGIPSEIRTVGDLQKLLSALSQDLPLSSVFQGRLNSLKVMPATVDLSRLRAAYTEDDGLKINSNIKVITVSP